MKNNWINHLATIVITLVFITLIGIVVAVLWRATLKPQTIAVEISSVVKPIGDTTKTYLLKTDLDSLNAHLKQLKSDSESLQNVRNEIVKLREEEDFYNKIYASIVALIVALAGFFGFKSMEEIKRQSLEHAEKLAKETAEIKATKVASETASSAVRSQFPEFFRQAKGVYEEDLQKARSEIQRLENRISAIELRQTTGIDANVNPNSEALTNEGEDLVNDNENEDIFEEDGDENK